ncbi:hypothetical protein IAT38_004327 [Cryptococcus sp. DSM 104549]
MASSSSSTAGKLTRLTGGSNKCLCQTSHVFSTCQTVTKPGRARTNAGSSFCGLCNRHQSADTKSSAHAKERTLRAQLASSSLQHTIFATRPHSFLTTTPAGKKQCLCDSAGHVFSTCVSLTGEENEVCRLCSTGAHRQADMVTKAQEFYAKWQAIHGAEFAAGDVASMANEPTAGSAVWLDETSWVNDV